MKIFFTKKKFVLLVISFLILQSAYSQNKDIDFLRDINLKRNMKLDKGFEYITHSVLPISVCTPAGMFATGLLTKDAELRNNGLEVGASFILASCISTGIKISVNRPRPYVTYPDIKNLVHTGPYSFPSGHTTAAFATATSLSLCYPKWYVIAPSFTWACLSGYSRMHLGVHYPSDVLTGILVGVGSAFAVHYGAKWIQQKK